MIEIYILPADQKYTKYMRGVDVIDQLHDEYSY